MGEQISDFKAWLYQIQLWLEKHPAIQKIIIALYAFIFILLSFFDSFSRINIISKSILFVVLLLFVAALVVIDTYHVRIIKGNRFELEERKRLISELLSLNKNVYKVKYRREIFDIETDGDATYTREMLLEFDNENVTWAEMLFGTTNEYGSDFDQMILKAFTYPDTKYPLSRVPIEATKSRMRFAIILRNKITDLHRVEGFQVTMKWLRPWKSLMTTLKDDGILRIDYDTSECILQLILPHGYSFIDFRMPRTNGEYVPDGKTDDGRCYMTYKLRDLPKGEAFTYFVEIKKGQSAH